MKTYIVNLLIKLTIVLSAFMLPIQNFLVLVGIAVFLDAFVAIAATIKINGWESVQSKRLKDTVVKSLIYFLALCLSHATDIAFDFDWSAKVVAGFIALTEMKSIDEKYYLLSGKSLFKGVIGLMPNMNKERDDSGISKKRGS